MNKRLNIIFTLFSLIFCMVTVLFSHASDYTPVNPKKLNYAYDTLEPYIDQETMILHYNKHYKGYIDKYNKAIKNYPELYSYSVEDLLRNVDYIPKDIYKTIINNGGGIYNHEFFFSLMTPNSTDMPKDLITVINRDFESVNKFKEEFKNKALSVFGSGWAWLVSDKDGNLSIITTPNQNTPITDNLTPVIGIDVWEHAYYLKYQNKRSEYIDNWFNVVNWNKALDNYNNR